MIAAPLYDKMDCSGRSERRERSKGVRRDDRYTERTYIHGIAWIVPAVAYHDVSGLLAARFFVFDSPLCVNLEDVALR